MNAQLDARILSSLALYLDYKLLKQAQAYTNTSGALYSITSEIVGMYAYSTPHKQLVNDTSITGANVMTGVWLDGNFIVPGQSGLYGINHYEGTVYFNHKITSPETRLSGVYAFKDFSVKITDQTDYKLIFGNKYMSNDLYAQTPTGLEEDVEIYPIIYIRPTTIENKPFGLAGLDDNTMLARAVIISDDMYDAIGAANVMKNLNLKVLPVYSSLPFNQMGLYTGGAPYNFEQLPQHGETPIIWKVKTSSLTPKGDELNLLNIKTMFADFEVRTLATHP
jgi:hypothetical protein